MADTLVLAGRKYNLLERSRSILLSSEDEYFPKAQLYNGWPEDDFRFDLTEEVNEEESYIQIDGNLIENFGMGNPGLGWTVTGGTVSFATSDMLLSGGNAAAHQDVQCRAGETLTIEASLEGDGTNATVIRVQNMHTDEWLTSGGLWQAAQTSVFSRSANTFEAQTPVSFTLPSFTIHLQAEPILRISVETATGNGGVDYIVMWPSIDLVSIHGHNLYPHHAVTIHGGSTLGGMSQLATMTKRQPAFYHKFSSLQSHRFYEINFLASGGFTRSIRLGEVIMGQCVVLSRRQKYGYETQWIEDNVSFSGSSGTRRSHLRSTQTRRALGLQFKFPLRSEMTQARDEVFRRSRGDAYPLVIVPDTDDEIVIHGQIERTWAVAQRFVGFYDDNDLMVVESPFASLGSIEKAVAIIEEEPSGSDA